MSGVGKRGTSQKSPWYDW